MSSMTKAAWAGYDNWRLRGPWDDLPAETFTECECCGEEFAYVAEIDADEDGMFEAPAPTHCEPCADHGCGTDHHKCVVVAVAREEFQERAAAWFGVA